MKKTCCLGYIGDYTTHWNGDYNKPLTNIMESKAVFFLWLNYERNPQLRTSWFSLFLGGAVFQRCVLQVNLREGKILPRWWGFKHFYFLPCLGRWSNLSNMFQGGWNHQLVTLLAGKSTIWMSRCISYWKRSIKNIAMLVPIGSMYAIFTCMYHENQPDVGRYTIPMHPMGFTIV